MGFTLTATRGTAAFLDGQGVAAEVVKKVYEGQPNIVDTMKDGKIALVINTTEGSRAVSDSRDIRAVALMDRIPYFTTAAAAIAAVAAMKARGEGYGVRTLQG
jgi:carbamoyl-phosphate synthase large subunit